MKSNKSNQTKIDQDDSSPLSAEPVGTKEPSKLLNANLSPVKPASTQLTVYSTYGYIEVMRENFDNMESNLLYFTKSSSKFKGSISVSLI